VTATPVRQREKTPHAFLSAADASLPANPVVAPQTFRESCRGDAGQQLVGGATYIDHTFT